MSLEDLKPVELKRSNPINIDTKGKKLVKVKISDIDDYNMKFLDLKKTHNELVKEHNSVLDDMEKIKKSNDDIKHDFDLIPRNIERIAYNAKNLPVLSEGKTS